MPETKFTGRAETFQPIREISVHFNRQNTYLLIKLFITLNVSTLIYAYDQTLDLLHDR